MARCKKIKELGLAEIEDEEERARIVAHSHFDDKDIGRKLLVEESIDALHWLPISQHGGQYLRWRKMQWKM